MCIGFAVPSRSSNTPPTGTEDIRSAVAELLDEPAARRFVLPRDGATASGCLTDPATVGETFLLGVEALL